VLTGCQSSGLKVGSAGALNGILVPRAPGTRLAQVKSDTHMPLLFLLLAACGMLLATCGADSPISPTELVRPASGRVFKVMTFNMAHGMDGTGRYNLQRTIDLIARVQPDLVGLQEVTRNHPKYGCDDQPALLAEGLRRATGHTWNQAYVREWSVHTDVACQQNGTGDGPNTEGLAVLAPEPITSVTSQKLWNSRIGLSARVSSAGSIAFIVTHLANSARNLDDRIKQVAQLAPWTESQGTPRVLMGDLNAAPGANELEPLMRMYHDAWAEAAAAGTARGIASGATRTSGSRRIDYVLYTPSAGLVLEWVETVDAAALVGVRASDHNPVVAAFRIQ
jgi:endonuclease/exonuclease/phosphatase family metal-dependent hydrolase